MRQLIRAISDVGRNRHNLTGICAKMHRLGKSVYPPVNKYRPTGRKYLIFTQHVLGFMIGSILSQVSKTHVTKHVRVLKRTIKILYYSYGSTNKYHIVARTPNESQCNTNAIINAMANNNNNNSIIKIINYATYQNHHPSQH